MLTPFRLVSLQSGGNNLAHYVETTPTPSANSPTAANAPAPTRRASSTSSTATASAAAPSTPSSRVHRSTLIASSQQRFVRAHHETITALGLLDLPFRCVITGDQAGLVRVYE